MCTKRFRSKWTAWCPPLLRDVWFVWGGEGRIQQDALIKPSPPPLPQDQRGRGLHDDFTYNLQGLHSHDRAALGLLFLEGRGEQIWLAGKVEKSFGEATGRARLREGLKLVDACHRRGAEHAVDALLRGEGWTFQVSLCTQLLGQSRTLQKTDWWWLLPTVIKISPAFTIVMLPLYQIKLIMKYLRVLRENSRSILSQIVLKCLKCFCPYEWTEMFRNTLAWW